MSHKAKQIGEEKGALDVKEFLIRNPDFLTENPELFTVLTPPDRSTDDEVVDFQTLMIEKIKRNFEDLKVDQGQLIDTSRNNLTTQAQVHEAVLALLDVDDVSEIGHMVTQNWVDTLHIDVIRICFEDSQHTPTLPLKDMSLLPVGSVKKYMGKDDIIQLRGDVEVSEEIFGPAKALIKAEALIRIPPTDQNPVGLLAFGSRDADMFYPGQGTELLRFLAKSFHKCLVQCLKRAP